MFDIYVKKKPGSRFLKGWKEISCLFFQIGLSLNLAMEWDLSLWYKHLPPVNWYAFNVPVTGVVFFFESWIGTPFWCKIGIQDCGLAWNGSRCTVKQVEINIQMDWQSEIPETNFQKKIIKKLSQQSIDNMDIAMFWHIIKLHKNGVWQPSSTKTYHGCYGSHDDMNMHRLMPPCRDFQPTTNATSRDILEFLLRPLWLHFFFHFLLWISTSVECGPSNSCNW